MWLLTSVKKLIIIKKFNNNQFNTNITNISIKLNDFKKSLRNTKEVLQYLSESLRIGYYHLN